ncbi:MAG: hypothetical protein IJI88_05285, partial [Atopobiaceae bacterium]|nr:hypothetical protein [Atopobiaceae bacterium]
VPDEPTPAAPTPEPEVVPDVPAPLAPVVDLGAWALLNLIAAAATVLLSAFRLGGIRRDEDGDESESSEDEEQRKNRRALRLATLVPAIGSVIAFILTEDMSLPMLIIDRWSPLMVAILVAQVVLAVLARNKDEEQDERQATA